MSKSNCFDSMTIAKVLLTTLASHGFSDADVNELIRYPDLPLIRELLRGQAKIKVINHVINLGKRPFVPKGWKIKEQRGSGVWDFDLDKIRFHQSPLQRKGVLGRKLLRDLRDLPVLNANVLDYLEKFPWLCGDDWFDKNIYFPGTTYIDERGRVVIRHLYLPGSKESICWGAREIDGDEPWLRNDFCSSQDLVFAVLAE